MYLILGDLVDVYILFYLDNILIYLAMAEDQTRHIRAVFEQLTKSKFYLKYKKYTLFLPEVNSLDMWYLSVECKHC